jgi:hypothetical protein
MHQNRSAIMPKKSASPFAEPNESAGEIHVGMKNKPLTINNLRIQRFSPLPVNTGAAQRTAKHMKP